VKCQPIPGLEHPAETQGLFVVKACSYHEAREEDPSTAMGTKTEPYTSSCSSCPSWLLSSYGSSPSRRLKETLTLLRPRKTEASHFFYELAHGIARAFIVTRLLRLFTVRNTKVLKETPTLPWTRRQSSPLLLRDSSCHCSRLLWLLSLYGSSP